MANTLKLSDISPADYDAVFYAGGHGPLWDLAEDRNSITLIETMYASGKPVATVCHAPAVLRHAKTQDGSPLITGQNPASSEPVAKAVLVCLTMAGEQHEG